MKHRLHPDRSTCIVHDFPILRIAYHPREGLSSEKTIGISFVTGPTSLCFIVNPWKWGYYFGHRIQAWQNHH
jgi:hypothetical protein